MNGIALHFLRVLKAIGLCLFLACVLTSPSRARTLRIAVVPKAVSNAFYAPVQAGCSQAAQALGDVQCVFEGPETSDPRLQDEIIERLVEDGVDGIAIAVINSEFLEKRSMVKASEANIPIVAFDSDFSGETLLRNPGIRDAYIGTDNYMLGYELGMAARTFRPEGGTVCILSGHKSAPGLNLRMRGARAAFAQAPSSGTWIEYERCPLYSQDDPDKALDQLLFIMDRAKAGISPVDTILVLGAWPQQNSQRYQEELTKRKNDLKSGDMVLVVGDTMEGQLALLGQGLAHANVGQSPRAMGEYAVQTLYHIILGNKVETTIHTPIEHCVRAEDSSSVVCTDRLPGQ